jgi:hypothetical protein
MNEYTFKFFCKEKRAITYSVFIADNELEARKIAEHYLSDVLSDHNQAKYELTFTRQCNLYE